MLIRHPINLFIETYEPTTLTRGMVQALACVLIHDGSVLIRDGSVLIRDGAACKIRPALCLKLNLAT